MSAKSKSLPDTLKEASRGNVTVDFARREIELYLQSLEVHEQGFRTSLSLLSPEMAERCQQQTNSIFELLQFLRQTLAEVLPALIAHDGPVVVGCADAILSTTHDLNIQFVAHREACLVALGPTALAGVNLITRTANAILDAGENPTLRQDLETQIEQELSRAEQALAQPGLAPQLEQALWAMQNALLDLQEWNDEDLESRLEAVWRGAEGVESVLGNLEETSAYPRLNLLLNLAQQVWEGTLEIELLLENCILLQNSVNLWRTQLASVLGNLSPTPMAQEQAHLLDSAYGSFDTVIVDFFDSVQQHNESAFETLKVSLITSWEEVAAAQRELELRLENQDKVPCVRCGRQNGSDLRNCERCGAILPRAAEEKTHAFNLHEGQDEPAGHKTEMTENLKRIFTAIDGFRCGELRPDEFQAEVDFFSALVHQARRAVEEDPHADQPLTLYLEGLQDIEAGLGFLECMDDPSQSSAAETAASLIWDGSGKIQASVRSTGPVRA